ncbi:DNA-directed RNA polymerase subunit beta [Brevibacillus ginsengisoli]|uniref:DNA-directed RNA polymerase subunit beta n=1 Tax=Brevibacillus ginsengisoli TaxID=363854 RepID=UPI003CEDB9DC
MVQSEGRRFSAEEQGDDKHSANRRRKPWAGVLAKLMLVPFLLLFSLVVGLAIGYSVIGKQPVSEVLSLQTYKHMYDLIFAGK